MSSLNIRRDVIMEGFFIFQDFEYPRFLRIQALHNFLSMAK